MNDVSGTPHVLRNLTIAMLFIGLLSWALIATLTLNYEASWREGDAFVNFVYEYNLPFWRVYCYSQAADLNGEFWISQNFAKAVNLTYENWGWWHFTIKGGTIIDAERIE